MQIKVYFKEKTFTFKTCIISAINKVELMNSALNKNNVSKNKINTTCCYTMSRKKNNCT